MVQKTISPLTGQAVSGWRNQPPPASAVPPQMVGLLHRVEHIERREELDKAKDRIIEMKKAHADELKKWGGKVQSAEERLRDMATQASRSLLERDSAMEKLGELRVMLGDETKRAQTLSEQLAAVEAAKNQADKEWQAKLKEQTKAAERAAKKAGKAAQQPSNSSATVATVAPPAKINLAPVRDAAGFLREVVLQADGWDDVRISVERGGDNSIRGVQIIGADK